MKKTGYFALVTFALVIAFSACKKEDPPIVDLGYGYFPVKVGSWIEYQVDSMWRNDNAVPEPLWDSLSYRMLERVIEEYTDDEGRPAHRIHRFIKNDQDEWVIRDVWTGTHNSSAAERTEENERRLKLPFPTRNNRSWDMNVYNTDEELEVNYKEVDTPYALNGMAFDSTLVVRNKVGPNAVNKRNFDERYVKNIGMVQKYWEESNTQTTYPIGLPPQVRVEGFRLDMEMVAYGQD